MSCEYCRKNEPEPLSEARDGDGVFAYIDTISQRGEAFLDVTAYYDGGYVASAACADTVLPQVRRASDTDERRARVMASYHLDIWRDNRQLLSIPLYLDDKGAGEAFAAFVGVAKALRPEAERVTLQRRGEYGEYVLEADV